MATITDPASWLYEQYRNGRFPMADSATGLAVMMEPEIRALLPISSLHLSASLLKTLRQAPFDVRIDTSFEAVIDACAAPTTTRPETWINPAIKDAFLEFHRRGLAHSVECWKDGELVGGLYGLEVGGAFCGESMFSKATDASKVALTHLCARLNQAGFKLLDAQYPNPHLDQFGLYRIRQEDYVSSLKKIRDEIHDFLLKDSLASEAELVVAYLKNRPSC